MNLPKNTPLLDRETLYRRRGKTAPVWYSVFDLGLEGVFDPSIAPPIGFVQSNDRLRIGGRFFPIVDKRKLHVPSNGSAILVYDHEDPWVTIATSVHELGHVASYCTECKHVPKTKQEEAKCKYKGEHDSNYYRILEPMYKQAQVPTYAAVMVEGKYDYPKHWNESSWR
jgi:hypothetical protein